VLRFLPGWVLGCLSVALVTVNTLLWSIPFYIVGAIYRVGRSHAWRQRWSPPLLHLGEGWVWCNTVLLKGIHALNLQIRGTENLRYDAWYLVTSNHQSWVDIPILQAVFLRKIPFIKFFLKRELIWVPVLGLAWWFLGLPFMRRYSRAELEKRPELRNADLDEVRRACDHFRDAPVAILNFVEGTRFTRQKHDQQQSPFAHLLRPKAGGIASVIGAMGEKLNAILDVTIVYPGGPPTFWEFACGRTDRVVVEVAERPLPPELIGADYTGDPAVRARFQEWIMEVWEEKERRMAELLQGETPQPLRAVG